MSTSLHALHSRYNPVAEAERYVNSLTLRDEASCFILIEPGLGYLIPFLRQKRPDAQLIMLHAAESNDALVPEAASIPAWSPRHDEPLQRFLENEIAVGATAIQVIEWRPALAVYGERYRGLLEETVEFIRRLDAGEQTLRLFGKRWFSNFFRNLRLLTHYTYPRSTLHEPVIVTGAGPSLESALPLIQERKAQGPALILAASSSTPSLLAVGLTPDFVISTDGGSWAQCHLYESLRDSIRTHTRATFILAVSMSAALPSQCADVPLLLMSDKSQWQSLILRGLSLPFVSLPQRGTVTASALDLAFCLTSGDVVISGTDLAMNDIRIHARPYSFERLLEEKASRFLPLYTQYFTRSRYIVEGKSHDVYAAWFRTHINSYSGRLYSLGKNSPVFSNAPSWTTQGRARKGSVFKNAANNVWEIARFSRPDPVKAGVSLLLKTLSSNAAVSAAIKQELVPLLFPDRPGNIPWDSVSLSELTDAIRTLAKLDMAHA
ncbi:MAG: DUF115 domain-containing protein [Treponema sp.]|jgi:hypothetical protein|nr:DUF115 domain-containing protein [Treponema sp.]